MAGNRNSTREQGRWRGSQQAESEDPAALHKEGLRASESVFVEAREAGTFAVVRRGDKPVREAQIGALHALGSHFTLHREPAIVALPTGVGKTVVAAATPFVLEDVARVLVVVPGVVLREQVTQALAEASQLRAHGLASDTLTAPLVQEVRSRQTAWDHAVDFDVVVSTPHCVSPPYLEEGENVPPPPDMFDLVIVDEAHHVPATTWTALIEHFAKAKKVFLTATPFRRDKRVIHGTIVYHYPLERAMAEGVFAPVELVGVTDFGTSTADRDRAIAEKAVERLSAPEHQGSSLLVRAASRARAGQLSKLYGELGVEVETVHHGMTIKKVNEKLEKVRTGEAHGVSFVGVLGEGFDLPRLKVGAYHDKHRSVPATVQFIGRLARPEADRPSARAEVVTVLEDLREDTWELYRHEAVWTRVLPRLVDELIVGAAERQRFFDAMPAPPEELSLHEIRPMRKGVLYEVTEPGWTFVPSDDHVVAAGLGEGDMFGGDRVWYSAPSVREGFLMFITESRKRPRWMGSPSLDTPAFGLHVAVLEPDPPPDSTYMMVLSTTRTNERDFALRIAGSDVPVRLVDPGAVIRLLQESKFESYFTVGLRNNQARGKCRKSYAMAAGTEVDRALEDTDRRGVTLGHTFGRAAALPGGRRGAGGASTDSGRLWENSYCTVDAYAKWARDVFAVLRGGEPQYLDALTGVSAPRRLAQWPEALLLDVEPHPMVGRGYELADYGDLRLIHFAGRHSDGTITLSAYYEDKRVWRGEALPDGAVEPIGEDLPVRRGPHGADTPLSDFLTAYPLTFYFSNGDTVRRGTLSPGGAKPITLPNRVLESYDWDGVDIESEVVGRDGRRSVQDRVQAALSETVGTEWVLRDDAAGEIADHIAVRQEADGLEVVFAHSKASSSPMPGVRVKDLDEVLGQTLRSRRWMQDPAFLWWTLQKRLAGRAACNVVYGDEEALVERCGRWAEQPPRMEIGVLAVQPGFSVSKYRKSVEGQQPHQRTHAVAEMLHAVAAWMAYDRFTLIGSK